MSGGAKNRFHLQLYPLGKLQNIDLLTNGVAIVAMVNRLTNQAKLTNQSANFIHKSHHCCKMSIGINKSLKKVRYARVCKQFKKENPKLSTQKRILSMNNGIIALKIKKDPFQISSNLN